MDIGTKIKLLREKNKLSQIELSEKLGIAQTTLGFIESGETKKVDFSLIDKICKIFDVDFDYFTNNNQTNNIRNLNGSVNNHGTINLISDEIIQQVKFLSTLLKEKEREIENLKVDLDKFK